MPHHGKALTGRHQVDHSPAILLGDLELLVPAPHDALPRSQNPARAYVDSLSGGQQTMTACLEAIARALSGGQAGIDSLPWALVRSFHTSAVRAALVHAVRVERYAPATANKYLASLRGALKAAWRLGCIETDEYLRAADLSPIAGSRQPAGRDVREDELAALLAGCHADATREYETAPIEDKRPAGRRDEAVIALAYLSGARRSEIAGLRLADLDLEPLSLRVFGKGDKERLVPVSVSARPPLIVWLEQRGTADGPLFCPISRKGKLAPGRTFTGEAIRQMLQRRARAAGLAAVTPHDLRRTYAGDLLDAGADLVAVQQLLGHASPATTSRYDRRGDRARRAAADRLHIGASETRPATTTHPL